MTFLGSPGVLKGIQNLFFLTFSRRSAVLWPLLIGVPFSSSILSVSGAPLTGKTSDSAAEWRQFLKGEQTVEKWAEGPHLGSIWAPCSTTLGKFFKIFDFFLHIDFRCLWEAQNDTPNVRPTPGKEGRRQGNSHHCDLVKRNVLRKTCQNIVGKHDKNDQK